MYKWKSYDHRYDVCDHGLVWDSEKRKVTISKPVKGYPGLVVNGKSIKIHRLVAQLFVPNPDNKPQVNHIDRCRHNNHYSNLEWVTQAENNEHARRTKKHE